MIRLMHTNTAFRRPNWSVIVVSCLVLIGYGWLLVGGRPADASSITGAKTKVYVYQGIAQIVPTSGTVMEIGNYSSSIPSLDIAVNAGSIDFLPGAGKALRIAAQDTNTEGGELVLLPPSSESVQWRIDENGNPTQYARFFTNVEKLIIDQNGNMIIPSGGSLCLGTTGGTPSRCVSSWTGFSSGSGTQNFGEVMSRGNSSNRSIVMGQGAGLKTATALIDITNNVGGWVPSYGLYADNWRDLTPGNGAAIYAQNPNGYAGYFSGATTIAHSGGQNRGPIQPDNVLDSPVLRIQNSPDNSEAWGATQYHLDARNTSANGVVAKFTGAVDISACTPGFCASPLDYALTVANTASVGTTLRVIGPAENGAAIEAVVTGGGYGIEIGGGATYSAFFRGHVGVEGKVELGTLKIGSQPRNKQTTEIRVCPVGTDTGCLGRHIGTIPSGSAPSRNTTTRYIYDAAGYTTAQVGVYDAAGNQLYELR